MKKIALKFTYHIDIILVPDRVAQSPQKYQKAFDEWLYDKTNNHGCWIVIEGEKVAVSFDTETFIDFLNNNSDFIGNEKAIILERGIKVLSEKIPTLFF